MADKLIHKKIPVKHGSIMDFPNYVPEGVRKHASEFLARYEASLSKSKLRHSEFSDQITYWQQPGHIPELAESQLDQLNRFVAAEINHQNTLDTDIKTIQRLVYDERMKDAYRILADAFFEDDEQDRQTKSANLIHAAWKARRDFSLYRDCLKRATSLLEEIADTADKLAVLLNKIEKTGSNCPSEFFSVPELLRNTESNKYDGYNAHIWRELRGYAFGDKHLCDPLQDKNTRFLLRDVWDNSPLISDLLFALSKSARDFKPSVGNDMVVAAIESQKRSEKTEFIRAFGYLLINQHKFILTTQIMKAMVPIANVAINAPDVDVTYDDLRKALKKLGQE